MNKMTNEMIVLILYFYFKYMHYLNVGI